MVDAGKASLAMDVIQDRATAIGNLPQYIVSETLFNRRQKQTAEAITGLKDFDVTEIDHFDGITRTGSTVPGCIFAVNVFG